MSARGTGIGIRRLSALLVTLTIFAWAGAKLLSAWERGGLDPLPIELSRGFRYPGGALGLVIGFAVARWTGMYRESAIRLADLFAPALPAGIAVVRVGCFFTGCCFGTRCDLPWATTYAPPAAAWVKHVRDGHLAAESAASLPVHPLQLYEAVLCLLLTGWVLRLQRGPHSNGQPFIITLVGLATIRLALAPLRADLPTYVWTIDLVILLAGLVATVLLRTAPISSPVPVTWNKSSQSVAKP